MSPFVCGAPQTRAPGLPVHRTATCIRSHPGQHCLLLLCRRQLIPCHMACQVAIACCTESRVLRQEALALLCPQSSPGISTWLAVSVRVPAASCDLPQGLQQLSMPCSDGQDTTTPPEALKVLRTDKHPLLVCSAKQASVFPCQEHEEIYLWGCLLLGVKHLEAIVQVPDLQQPRGRHCHEELALWVPCHRAHKGLCLQTLKRLQRCTSLPLQTCRLSTKGSAVTPAVPEEEQEHAMPLP